MKLAIYVIALLLAPLSALHAADEPEPSSKSNNVLILADEVLGETKAITPAHNPAFDPAKYDAKRECLIRAKAESAAKKKAPQQ